MIIIIIIDNIIITVIIIIISSSSGTSSIIFICACRAGRGNSQRLAKSSPYAGPSAGTEVARLRKWHVWCLLGGRSHGILITITYSNTNTNTKNKQ